MLSLLTSSHRYNLQKSYDALFFKKLSIFGPAGKRVVVLKNNTLDQPLQFVGN